MGILINATTASAVSPTFRVVENNLGLYSDGLAGVETVDIQVQISDGTFKTVGQMTVADPDHRLLVNGTYRLSKAGTAGAVSAHSL